MGSREILSIEEAARILHEGGVVAYPTESCFGLGCDPAHREAVDRILAIKGRDVAKGLILIGGAWEHLAPFMGDLPEQARARLRAAWPGPVTFLIPPSARVPDWVRGSHPRVALRWTAHPQAARLCRVYRGAVVSTSANREGSAPLRTAEAVQAELGAEIDGCMTGRVGMRARPSVIVDAVTGERIR